MGALSKHLPYETALKDPIFLLASFAIGHSDIGPLDRYGESYDSLIRF